MVRGRKTCAIRRSTSTGGFAFAETSPEHAGVIRRVRSAVVSVYSAGWAAPWPMASFGVPKGRISRPWVSLMTYFGRRQIEGEDGGQQAGITARMLDRLQSGEIARRQECEGDPQRQEHHLQRARQRQGSDPHMKKVKTPHMASHQATKPPATPAEKKLTNSANVHQKAP